MKKTCIKLLPVWLCLLAMPVTAFAQDAQELQDKLRDMANSGSAAEDKGDYDNAIKIFTAALQLAPAGKNGAWFYTERGNVYYDKEDFVAALKDYNSAIGADPGYALAFVGRGNACDEQGDHDKALADYTKAILLDPKYVPAYVNRAVTYNRKGMHDEAIADCNTALGIDPQSPDAYEDRAIGYDGKGERDKAMADYNKVIEIDPKYAEAFVYRGSDYTLAGDYAKAVSDLQTALGIDPEYVIAHNDLAWLLATCPDAGVRDGKKAVANARQACELSGWMKPASVDTLAAAYAESGDFDAAVKFEQWYLTFPGIGKQYTADARARLALYQSHQAYREVGK